MKLKINITQPIVHGIQWFKAQNTQHPKIYNNDITNLRNKEIDFVTSWSAELELCWFKPCNAPMFLYEACEVDWKRNGDLIVHEFARICICHGWVQASICCNLALFSSIPRANLLDNTSGWWIKQEKWMLLEEIWRNFWERILRNFLDLKKWLWLMLKQLGFLLYMLC